MGWETYGRGTAAFSGESLVPFFLAHLTDSLYYCDIFLFFEQFHFIYFLNSLFLLCPEQFHFIYFSSLLINFSFVFCSIYNRLRIVSSLILLLFKKSILFFKDTLMRGSIIVCCLELSRVHFLLFFFFFFVGFHDFNCCCSYSNFYSSLFLKLNLPSHYFIFINYKYFCFV
jgi:hypothetical protein